MSAAVFFRQNISFEIAVVDSFFLIPFFDKLQFFLRPNFLRRRQLFEKKDRPKKALSNTFWRILTKKLRFRHALALKISIFWRFLGSVSQKWVSQSSTKGDSLGRQGVESLRRGVRLLPAP